MDLIVDANNIANIAYHRAKSIMMKERSKRVKDDPDSYEEQTDYIDGVLPNFATKIFFNIFHKYLKDFNVTHAHIVWDGKRGSHWRKQENVEYKSNRDHSRDEFYHSFIQSVIQEKELLDSYPVYQYGKEYAEADDLIYSLCDLIERDILIISSDGDLVQLAQKFEHVTVWNPRTKKYMTPPEYDLVTYKSIIGDNSDNIFGLYKFGPKKAIKTIEANLENLDEEQKKTVENNRLIIDLALNPDVKKNNEFVNKQLSDSKISLDPNKIKKLYFNMKLSEFLKKWDPIYDLLLQLEKESLNGGKQES